MSGDVRTGSEAPPGFPEPDRRSLHHPPVELVIFELLLLADGKPVESKGALALKSVLMEAGWDVQHLESTQRRNLSLKVVGDEPEVVVGEEASGWSLVASDKSVSVSIFPTAVTAQVNGYRSWEKSLAPGLAGLLNGLGQVLQPSGVQRVGLRYVNRCTDPSASEPRSWRGRIEDSLLGPVLHPQFGDALVSAQQQVDLVWAQTERGVLRHGPFPDGSVGGALSYLLDIDISDTESGTFDPGRVLTVVDGLHLRALHVFQASLTPQYLRVLRGDET
ncbi:TIGR04255 family protein [Streptomyces sp900105245]|uniref:TIGR04255 family protein n=1 Tax=Streptomyces sp. 900105245 TaxID=3154379 RepID=UPI00333429E3